MVDWLTIFSVLFAVGAVAAAMYLFIIYILPTLRTLSGLVIKEEKAQDAVLFLFLVYIVVISAVKALRAVQNLGNKYINLVANGFTQGLEVFTDSFYYLGFLVLLVFIALALRYLLFAVKETSDRKR